MASNSRSVNSSSSRRKAASPASMTAESSKGRTATINKTKAKQPVGKTKSSSAKEKTAAQAKKPASKSKASSIKVKSAGPIRKSPEKNSKSRAELIRQTALSYPETSEDFPWGHSAFKVRNKTFCWMSFAENGMKLTLKLTESRFQALSMPSVEESNYGLGKHGWVTAFFTYETDFPIEMLRQWLDESFRAVAPKAMSKLLPPTGSKRRSLSGE